MSERIAVIATGGISHWPCTPDSGKINEAWDRDFLARWCRNDRAALLNYSDEEIYRDGGQGGYEIRNFIAAAGAAEGSLGEIWCYEPIPQFSCGCTIGVMNLSHASQKTSRPRRHNATHTNRR
jgi:2,3-dihydroxyphenylpropionate 1,2-dioxygenase